MRSIRFLKRPFPVKVSMNCGSRSTSNTCNNPPASKRHAIRDFADDRSDVMIGGGGHRKNPWQPGKSTSHLALLANCDFKNLTRVPFDGSCIEIWQRIRWMPQDAVVLAHSGIFADWSPGYRAVVDRADATQCNDSDILAGRAADPSAALPGLSSPGGNRSHAAPDLSPSQAICC